MRTQEEIVARIEGCRESDMFGFEWPIYLEYLHYGNAKPYIKEEIKETEWAVNYPKDQIKCKAEAEEYMEFAWEKANECRGISANRSMAHYKAWIWLLGEDWLDKTLEEGYDFYGKDILVKICDFLKLDSKKWDNGRRARDEYHDEELREQQRRQTAQGERA